MDYSVFNSRPFRRYSLSRSRRVVILKFGIGPGVRRVLVRRPIDWDELLNVTQQLLVPLTRIGEYRFYYSPRGACREYPLYEENYVPCMDGFGEDLEEHNEYSAHDVLYNGVELRVLWVPMIEMRLYGCCEGHVGYKMRPGSHFRQVMDDFAEMVGIERETLRFLYGGQQFGPNDQPLLLGMKDRDEIEVYEDRSGKPAIHLLSSTAIPEASVTVAIRPMYDFQLAALRPRIDTVFRGSGSGGGSPRSHITWKVCGGGDGLLTDGGGARHTCLSWAAVPRPRGAYALTPVTAVVLAADDAVAYLQRTLPCIGLTPAMRESFMAYWMAEAELDSKLEVALTFVPQDVYGHAVALTVVPEPATVGRIFMLYGEVCTTGDDPRWDAWKNKRLSVDQAIKNIDWAQKIGLHVAGLKDEHKFRVMEWGVEEISEEKLVHAVPAPGEAELLDIEIGLRRLARRRMAAAATP